MTILKSLTTFLTGIPKKNKSGTSQKTKDSYINQAATLQGDQMYISNEPLAQPPDEKLLIAYEVRELMLLLLEQGEQATHDEIHYVVFMMNCLIDEICNEPAFE